MTYKRLICPICKNLCKSPHYKTCGNAKDKNLFKMDVLAFNFREIPLFNKSFWETKINNCANLEQLLIDKLSRFLELHHQE